MESLGKVTAILDDAFVLVESAQALEAGLKLTVLGSVEDERLKSLSPTGRIDYPKGDIRVVYPQGGNIYLAERFREYTTRTHTVRVPNPMFAAMEALQLQLGGRTKEVVERVPGPWSAELDLTEKLGVSFPMAVVVGDAVARAE